MEQGPNLIARVSLESQQWAESRPEGLGPYLERLIEQDRRGAPPKGAPTIPDGPEAEALRRLAEDRPACSAPLTDIQELASEA